MRLQATEHRDCWWPWTRRQRHGADFLSEPSERFWSFQYFEFELPPSRTVREWISDVEAPQLLVLCYSSLRKLKQLQRLCACLLGPSSCLLFWSLDKASCHVGKVHMAWNWGPQFISPQGAKSFQWHMSEAPSWSFGWGHSPGRHGQHLDWSFVRDPEVEDPVRLCLDSWPTETVLL